jgi:hypothetical protein
MGDNPDTDKDAREAVIGRRTPDNNFLRRSAGGLSLRCHNRRLH